MTKLSNISNRDSCFIVVGSSSSLSVALQSASAKNEKLYFFGRTNPHNLQNWVKLKSVTSINDADDSAASFTKLLQAISLGDVPKVGLVILSGVSSEDWSLSFAVNQYYPSVLSQVFIDQMN